MRTLRRSLALAVAFLAVAGCGGGGRAEPPPLPAALAERLAARSDAVAARLEGGDPCAARAEAESLQEETIVAVNERRVPRRYQEELLAAVTALVDAIECAPAPPPEQEAEDPEDEDEKGKAKGKKDKKDKDEEEDD